MSKFPASPLGTRILEDAARWQLDSDSGLVLPPGVREAVEESGLEDPENIDTARAVLGLTLESAREIEKGLSRDEEFRRKELANLRNPDIQILASTLPERITRPGSYEQQMDALLEIIQVVGTPEDLGFFRAFGLKAAQLLGRQKGLMRMYMSISKWFLHKQMKGFVDIMKPVDMDKNTPEYAEAMAKQIAARMMENGRHGYKQIVNYVVEAAKTPEEARRVINIYKALVRAGVDSVAVKPTAVVPLSTSAAGADLNEGRLADVLVEILTESSTHPRKDGSNVRIEVDSEWSGLTEMTVGAATKASGAVLDVPFAFATQAYDRRTETMVVEKILKASRQRISEGGIRMILRLVNGANLLDERHRASANGHPAIPMVGGRVPRAMAHANYQHLLKKVAPVVADGELGIVVASMNLQTLWKSMIDLAKAGAFAEANGGFISLASLKGMLGPETYRFFEKRYGKALKGILDFYEYVPVIPKDDIVEFFAYYTRRMDEIGGGKVIGDSIEKEIANWIGVSTKYGVGSDEWLQTQVRMGLLLAMRYDEEHERDDLYPIEIANLGYRGDRETWHHSLPQSIEDFRLIPRVDERTSDDKVWMRGLMKDCRLPKVPSEAERVQLHFPPQGGVRTKHDFESRLHDHLPKEDEAGERIDRSVAKFELGTRRDIDKAFELAKNEKEWSGKTTADRATVLLDAVATLVDQREDVDKALMMNVFKSIYEAEGETDEAIEFGLLHPLYMRKFLEERPHLDVGTKGNGTHVVICPKNFPVAIPLAHIVAKLLSGHRVIVKPSGGQDEETLMATYAGIKHLWDAGVPKDALVWMPCSNEDAAYMTSHEDCESVGFTGSTPTAKAILKGNNKLEMIAETGGRNIVVVDETTDLGVFAREMVLSMVGAAGQKCSKAIAIVATKDVDIQKLKDLMRDICKQMLLGMPYDDLAVDCTPLSKKLEPTLPDGRPNPLYVGMTKTNPGESWLHYNSDPEAPKLKFASMIDNSDFDFSKLEEIFGPIATLVQIDGGVDEAFEMINDLPGTLTGAFWSQNRARIAKAVEKWQTGQLYINKKPTGALAAAQFGDGTGDSHLGMHGCPTGSEEFVVANSHITRRPGEYPKYDEEIKESSHPLATVLQVLEKRAGSAANNEKLWALVQGAWSCLYEREQYFDKARPMPFAVEGEVNWVESRKVGNLIVRAKAGDDPLTIWMKVFAGLAAGNSVYLSVGHGSMQEKLKTFIGDVGMKDLPGFAWGTQSEAEFIRYIDHYHHIAVDSKERLDEAVLVAAAEKGKFIDAKPATCDGFVDMIHQYRVQSMSVSTHQAGDDSYQKRRTFVAFDSDDSEEQKVIALKRPELSQRKEAA